MAHDVTFHPVDSEDLQYFLFDIVDNPALAVARAREISNKVKVQELIGDLYTRVPEWFSDKTVPFNASVSLLAAIIAGCRHPFWYCRTSALSFASKSMPEIGTMFTPLPMLAKGSISSRQDPSRGRITDNYTGSGVIKHELLTGLQNLFPRIAPALAPAGKGYHFDADGFRSLLVSVNYAREKGLGLLEASDIVTPASGNCLTDYDNMRASFLKRIDA